MELKNFEVLVFTPSSPAKYRAVVRFQLPAAYTKGGLTCTDVARELAAAKHPLVDQAIARGWQPNVSGFAPTRTGKLHVRATNGVIEVLDLTANPISEVADGTDLSALGLMLFCDCE